MSVGAFGQSPDAKPTFEIADVHTSPHRRPISGRPMQVVMQGGFLSGNRYVLKQATMVDLISTTYGVEAEKVLGGPNWLEFDRFDIIAKVPPVLRRQRSN